MGMPAAELHQSDRLMNVTLDSLQQGVGKVGISEFVDESHGVSTATHRTQRVGRVAVDMARAQGSAPCGAWSM